VKLSDLLDDLRDNILNDRGTSTGDDDKLWSDTTLVRYINEAQRRFAKRSFVIRDSRTAEVVNVTVREGVTEYDLHPSIIAVVSAKIERRDDGPDPRRPHGARSVHHPERDHLPSSFDQANPAAPMAFATDETLVEDDEGTVATVSMRLFPTPRPEDDGTIIKLRVIRMPLDELTTDDLEAIPEVPADHHLEMLDWAAYLALRIVDDDAGNPKRAQEFANSFEAHVVEARKLVLNKLYAPQRWGFGRGGWGGYCNG
jgi:hypothetical protein